MALDLLQKSLGRLHRVRKQRDLLRRRGSLMLQRKAKTVEDLEELERLETDGPDPLEGERPPKRTCQEGPSVDPSFSGGGSGEPDPPAEAGSSVDYSRMPFWESSLDALFSEGVDPLASGDLGFEGGIP